MNLISTCNAADARVESLREGLRDKTIHEAADLAAGLAPRLKVPRRVVSAILGLHFHVEALGGGNPTEDELLELWKILKQEVVT